MTMPRITIRPGFSSPRIIKGNWQIAGDHSASVDHDDELYQHMADFADAGITAFDCGDIYYGVEERIGNFIERFRRERGREAAERISVHTKYCAGFLNEAALRSHSRNDLRRAVETSLRRLKLEQIDLVQLSWWNYEIEGSVQAALWLQEMQKEGKVAQIGLTNFNIAEMDKIIAEGVDVVSNQVQYSVLDRRPQNVMSSYCQSRNVALFCYGGMAGGFLSGRWLGIPDPGRPAFENVSLDKYYRIIRDFGGWSLYQELLEVLKLISEAHGVAIPVVATRYVLDQPGVAGVIQGARHSKHIAANLQVFDFALTDDDYRRINEILDRSSGPLGDCYDLDRSDRRDAEEELKTEYYDVENGVLVRKTRSRMTVAEPYGHHLNQLKNQLET